MKQPNRTNKDMKTKLKELAQLWKDKAAAYRISAILNEKAGQSSMGAMDDGLSIAFKKCAEQLETLLKEEE